MERIQNFFESLTISFGGVNDTLNGQIYQVELLLYILQKAQVQFENYGLSTELKEFGVFDDAVLNIADYGTIAVQAKWKKNPKQFQFRSFFSAKENDFYLYKYFLSLKEIEEMFSDIRQVVICTNQTLPDKDIIELTGGRSKLYASKIQDESIFTPFKRFKFESSDLMTNHEIFNCFKAQFIAIEISGLLRKEKNKHNYVILKSYKKLLVEKFIDPNTGKFNSDLEKSTDQFVKCLIEALKEKNVSLKTDLTLLQSFLEQIIFNLNDEDVHMDQLITTFLKKFELVVDVKRSDFEKGIIPLLQEKFHLKNVKSIKSNLQEKIMDWVMSLESGKFFHSEMLNKLNNDVRNNINSVRIIERTSRIFHEYPDLEFAEVGPQISQFICQDAKKLQKRILYCQSESQETFLASLKFYQLLKLHLLDTFMFVQTSGPEEHFQDAIKVFAEVRSYKILVIEINGNSQVFLEFRPQLFNLVQNHKSKKIILVSDVSHCPNEPMIEYMKEVSYKLVDLKEDSLIRFLEKPIQFQEKQVNIGSIISNKLKQELSLIDVFNCRSIGSNVISNEVYNKNLYIPRKLRSKDQDVYENELLELKDIQEFLIVVNSAGMGKTSLLNHLAEELKDRYPHHWIINISLNNHTKYFKENYFLDCKSIAEFLLTDFLKFQKPFEKSLFQEALLNEGNVQIILDGLDEIAPNYTKPVLNLMKSIFQLAVKKIFVSTRPELGDLLEKEFKKDKLQIHPFNREEQETFLVNFWKESCDKVDESSLRDFSSKLLNSINESMTDEEFTGTPLTTKLIGEIYQSQASSGTDLDKVAGATNLFDLFNQFLDEKVRIICEEKMKVESSMVLASDMMKSDKKLVTEFCQRICLSFIVSPEELKFLPEKHYIKLSEVEFKKILKYGFITGSLGNEKFIHKTLAEFFGLLYFVMNLEQEREIFTFFVTTILTDRRFQVIRTMFDSFLENPTGKFDPQIFTRHVNTLESKFETYGSVLSVACIDRNEKIVECFFNSLADISDSLEVKEFLISKNSFLIPYFSNFDDDLKLLCNILMKFGINFVKNIFQVNFELPDGSITDVLSSTLSHEKNSVNLLKFVRENFLWDTNFVEFLLFKNDQFGLNFIQKVFNLKSSEQKIELSKTLLQMQVSEKLESTAIVNEFFKNFQNSHDSLFVEVIKMKNFEVLELLCENFILYDSKQISEILQQTLNFCVNEFEVQLNVYNILFKKWGSKWMINFFAVNNLNVISPKYVTNYLDIINFLFDQLDPAKFNFDSFLHCLEKVKSSSQKNLSEKLITFNYQNLTLLQYLISKGAPESDIKKVFQVLGPDLSKELVILGNRGISQTHDLDLIQTHYRIALDYFDNIYSLDADLYSSFQILKFEAFRKLSFKYNFDYLIKLNNYEFPNRILFDLKIIFETSDEFEFSDPSNVETFGMLKLAELLTEPNFTQLLQIFNSDFLMEFWFKKNYLPSNVKFLLCLVSIVFTIFHKNSQDIKFIIDFFKKELNVEEIDTKYLRMFKEVILNQNSPGKSFFHLLVDSKLKDSELIEFIKWLDQKFGSELISDVLKLKNNDGFTFWSHANLNKDVIYIKEIKFYNLLEHFLIGLNDESLTENNFESLEKSALNEIFNKNNSTNIYKISAVGSSIFVRYGILTEKFPDSFEFSDSCFLNYFGLKGFYYYLKKNYDDEETAKLCLNIFAEKNKFNEFCWLIDIFFDNQIMRNNFTLHKFAEFGEENKNLFFLLLETLLNRLTTGKDSEKVKNILFSANIKGEKFLHKFCRYDFKWNQKSFEKFFKKLKEIKTYLSDYEMKQHLMVADGLKRSFIYYIENFELFKITTNFLINEFEINFVQELLLMQDKWGNSLWGMKKSVANFIKALNLFKDIFNKSFLKIFLMQTNYKNACFLLWFPEYSFPGNFENLMKLFDLIFSIFGPDFELFNSLFSKSNLNESFLSKLTKNYEHENKYEKELNSFFDLIKSNLGEEFFNNLKM